MYACGVKVFQVLIPRLLCAVVLKEYHTCTSSLNYCQHYVVWILHLGLSIKVFLSVHKQRTMM